MTQTVPPWDAPPWRLVLPYRRDLDDAIAGPPEWRCWGCCARSLRRLVAGYVADGAARDEAERWAVLHLLFGHEPRMVDVLEAERWIRDNEG